MIRGIVRKIFLSIVVMFVIVMAVQMVFQNFFLEDMYVDAKISKMQKSFEELCQDYQNNPKQMESIAIRYREENESPVVFLDESGYVLNESFFDSLNYVLVRDEGGKEFKVSIDEIVDEQGEFRDLEFYENGQKIDVVGAFTLGGNFIEPFQISSDQASIVFDSGKETWRRLYKEDEARLAKISGEIEGFNLIERDGGVLSYQPDKLLNEIRHYIAEKNEDPESIKEVFKNGGYDFVEEYSGLMHVVMAREMDDGVYVFSLFTVENVHDAFLILNGYYYYMFAFQFLLVLVLVYSYSRWISKPLIKLIDSAKSISEFDFTKRTDIKTNDELSLLSNSLNSISENLSNAIEDLEESNRKLEIEAVRKAKNEERMRNMLTSLSHEFKTPLGIMSGFLEVIQDGLYEKEPEYYMDVISQEIDKLNGLVLETIELSKLETGSYELNVSQFQIKPFVEIASEKLKKRLEEKNMDLKLDLQDLMVSADMKKIEQVMINILINAIRYSPKGERIEVVTEVSSGKLYVRTRNYGVSIDDEDLKLIWDRFYRTEKSRNRELGGSGLGLAIVRNILELHGSDYGIRNIDSGVEFYFSLEIKN